MPLYLPNTQKGGALPMNQSKHLRNPHTTKCRFRPCVLNVRIPCLKPDCPPNNLLSSNEIVIFETAYQETVLRLPE